MKSILFLSLFLGTCNLFGQVNLTQGLKVYLPFNGNTLDASGNGNNATNNGAVLTSDQFGNNNSAYYFNGVNNYLTIPNSLGIQLSDSLTLSAMVILDTFNSATCQGNSIFHKGINDFTPGWYTLRISDQAFDNNCSTFNPNNENCYGHVDNIGTFPFGTTAGQAGAAPYIQLHQWHCFVMTWDGDSLKTYIDGALATKYPITVPSSSLNNDSLYIGATAMVNNRYWLKGKIDEIRVYKRVLNNIEINALCGYCSSDYTAPQILSNDTTICLGNSITINTNIIQTDSFYWLPNIGISNPNSITPTITPSSSSTYYLNKIINECNLVTNSTFEGGPYGFTSTYTYTAPAIGANTTSAEYTVSNNPNPWNSTASNCIDHTTGNGNMLIINGASIPNISIWSQSLAVSPNTNYNLSAWVSQWSNISPSILQFSINGTPIGTPYNSPVGTCNWNQFFTNWNSGLNTSAVVSILNQSSSINGNDFAIDDIYFGVIDTLVDSIQISVAPIPTANAGSDINICQGGNTSINASITGSSTSFIWTPTIGLSNATVLNPTASPTVTTTYSLITSNLAGCHDTDDIKVFVNALPIVSAGTDTSYCDNTNGVLLNGSGIGSASWSPTTNLSNPNILNPIANPSSNTNYTLTVTNSNNCSASDVVQVSKRISPTITVSPNVTICSGDSTTLIASGATNYFWSPTINTIINNNQNIAFPIVNTTYSVIGTTTNNCADTASVIVTILPIANLSISGDSLLCAGDTILLYANGATSYQWNPANLIISQIAGGIVTSPLVSTIYSVNAVDNNNCKSSKTVNIIVDQIPNLQITKSNDLQCAQTSSLLQASGALTYVWSPSATLNSATISNPTAIPTATTTYSVLASGMACITIDSITVKVFNSIAEKTFVPNVFSPNGDGLNDYFTPISKSNFVNYSLKIYNRWGELVYFSNNANDCWDGQQKNGQIEIGTYFYILNAKTECSSIDWKGDITLIK
jgi:gliding motility-associated-like protein